MSYQQHCNSTFGLQPAAYQPVSSSKWPSETKAIHFVLKNRKLMKESCSALPRSEWVATGCPQSPGSPSQHHAASPSCNQEPSLRFAFVPVPHTGHFFIKQFHPKEYIHPGTCQIAKALSGKSHSYSERKPSINRE